MSDNMSDNKDNPLVKPIMLTTPINDRKWPSLREAMKLSRQIESGEVKQVSEEQLKLLATELIAVVNSAEYEGIL